MKSVVVQIRIEKDQNGASPKQSFIVSYSKLLWLRVIVQGVNKASYPIQTPLLLVAPIKTW
jgi:hypothetical protein